MSELKLNTHLGVILFVLAGAIAWSSLSAWQELNCHMPTGWFSRSGAILAGAAIFFNLVTKPFVYDNASPDLVNIYEHKLGRADLKEDHWAKKAKAFEILIVLELIFAVTGTVIWAYGDLWFSTC
jgi:Zn-dependent membrane protease YugP